MFTNLNKKMAPIMVN